MVSEEPMCRQVQVERLALTVDTRASHCLYSPPRHIGLAERAKRKARGLCRCRGDGGDGGVWSWVKQRVPILEWLPKYNIREALLGDVIGGVTVGIMHIPQGMAYALLAGLPPITGLYMAFFPVLIYVVLGTSRHVSMGTFAVACLMMGKVVGELSHTHTDDNNNNTTINNNTTTTPPLLLQLMDSETTTTNTIFTTNNNNNNTTPSPPPLLLLNMDYKTVVVVGPSPTTTNTTDTTTTPQYSPQQVAAVLALMVGLWETYVEIGKRLPSANPAAVVVSVVCISILVFNNEVIKPRVKKYTRLPVPIELMVVILGTLVSYLSNLDQHYQVRVVGHVPTGLPAPTPPPVELWSGVALDAFIIGVVGYTSTFSMAKIFAKRQGYTVYATQELYAQGASNVFGAFFSCGPMAASLSRSLIQEAVGSVTLLTPFFSCLVLLLVLLFIGPLFETLPNQCVLSSIIVVALKGLFLQVRDFKTLWWCSRLDALVWLTTFLTSVIVDIDYGLAVGVVVSVLVLVARSQAPPTARLGHVSNTDLYLDINKYHKAVELPGLRIFSFSGSIHFANASYFKSRLLSSCELDLSLPRRRRHHHHSKHQPHDTAATITNTTTINTNNNTNNTINNITTATTNNTNTTTNTNNTITTNNTPTITTTTNNNNNKVSSSYTKPNKTFSNIKSSPKITTTKAKALNTTETGRTSPPPATGNTSENDLLLLPRSTTTNNTSSTQDNTNLKLQTQDRTTTKHIIPHTNEGIPNELPTHNRTTTKHIIPHTNEGIHNELPTHNRTTTKHIIPHISQGKPSELSTHDTTTTKLIPQAQNASTTGVQENDDVVAESSMLTVDMETDTEITKEKEKKEEEEMEEVGCGVQWVILELSGVGYVDTMACRLLTQLFQDLKAVGITLCLAAPSESVLCSLGRCGSLEVFTAHHIFHSVHDAVTLLLPHHSPQLSPSLSPSQFTNCSPVTL
ncbi:hypothetical protein Pcinc_024615 [Petrolisthes cinctipes]|uniref:STAS domain-containing protein n=1 Tax=Petrolisthes cinctipes TaxID=88211 RepID=A0AAE1KD97_PETCI|nr:hypothetical protein Pcinc_024615 [Petrolisthes cinctipes]